MKLFYTTKGGLLSPRFILRIAVVILIVFSIIWIGWDTDLWQMFHTPNYWEQLAIFSVIGIIIGEFIYRIQRRNVKQAFSGPGFKWFLIVQFCLGVLLPWLLLYLGGRYLPQWLNLETDMSMYFRYCLPHAFVQLMTFNALLLCVFGFGIASRIHDDTVFRQSESDRIDTPRP